jgi:hypothetical protein
VERITEAELADWEAKLNEGQWLPRLVSLGLLVQVRELQARVAELEQQERDRDAALAGQQPLPEEKKE